MTLTELLLVLSLTSLTMLFFSSSNDQLRNKNQITHVENQLTAIVQFSRNSALATGKNLTINSVADDGNWSSGLVLFVDNPSHHYTAQDQVIHRWPDVVPRNIQLRWKGFQSSNYIVFSPSIRHATSGGHFDILQQGIVKSQIVVNRLGSSRIRSESNE